MADRAQIRFSGSGCRFLGPFMVEFFCVGIGSRTAGRLQRRLRCRRRPDPHPRSFCDDWICRFSPSGMQVAWSANVAQGKRSATCSRQARPLLKLRTEANTQCHSFPLAFREQAQSPAPENHFEDSRRVRFRKVWSSQAKGVSHVCNISPVDVVRSGDGGPRRVRGKFQQQQRWWRQQ